MRAETQVYNEAEIWIPEMLRKRTTVRGLEGVQEYKEEHPDKKTVIIASHTHNFDALIADDVFKKLYDVQLTGESVLKEDYRRYPGQAIMINLLLREAFSPISYKENERGKHGVFRPDDFTAISEEMDQGKTPWLALNSFSPEGKLTKAGVGGLYLALKNDAAVIPAALNAIGGDASMENTSLALKNLLTKGDLKGLANIAKDIKSLFSQKYEYNIGQPLELEPYDLSGFDAYFAKRKAGEAPTDAERQAFRDGHAYLRELADSLGYKIAGLLTNDRRGVYGQEAT